MRAPQFLEILALSLFVHSALSAEFEFYPGAVYDATIPRLKDVVGHDFGEEITSCEQIERYIRALAKASPKRTRLVKYAQSWEGRALHYLIIASEANINRVDSIKAGLQQLANPRSISESGANKLIDSLPAVTWLAYGVHGNEISSPDAALVTAFHVLAARNDAITQEILEKTILIIDPTENPDGRERFIQYFASQRGRWPDAESLAAERNESWPSGRGNHYLFDMNRDWLAQTQPETQGRVASYLDWYPAVFVDLHEMGGNSTYYFPPVASPLNPNISRAQIELLSKFGKANSEWFDKFRFDYFTRDVYDSFYPGYGDSWPMLQGSIGMTYEQASTRGLIFSRSDGTQMHFRDAVHHHFVASLSTAQHAAHNAKELLRYFYDYRRKSLREIESEKTREYILTPGRDPNRAAKLVSLLMHQGIEVQQADTRFKNNSVRNYVDGKLQSKEFPAGSFVISLYQPAKHLVKTLLDKHTAQPKDFLDEQHRRLLKRLPQQFYDVTAWSLPLLYDVDMYMAERASQGNFAVLKQAPKSQSQVTGGKAHLAYLIPWGTQAAASASIDLVRQGVRLFRSSRSFTLGDTNFPEGTIIIKVKDNVSDLSDRVERAAVLHGATIHATNRAWIEVGDSLGSERVRFVESPKIALAWNEPSNPMSAGWTRYILEQQYGMPVTIVRSAQLRSADLSKFNVLILPDGGPDDESRNQVMQWWDILGEAGVQNIKSWVQSGGTLITFARATQWLTDKRVGLLATTRELKGGKPDQEDKSGKLDKEEKGGVQKPASEPKAEETQKEFDLAKGIEPERAPPDATPGAMFRVNIDNEHWLGFGYSAGAPVMVDGKNIFTPLKLDKGTNVATYASGETSLLSGFTWGATLKQLQNKAYLMHQTLGRGNIVAFAEDPNYRAFMDGLNILFLNAAIYGPTYRKH